ncbi:MAG: HNH endonuclease [Herminiimonas sp.]|nr:HNH endonuclease [Herminiimonas sp.]
MHRKLIEPPAWQILQSDERCPLCERLIPPAQRDAHHLVPKMKGGRQTVAMHRICHRQVHALFSETELARQFSTAEALLCHPEIQKFVGWVRTKPDDFFERTRRAGRRR